MEYETDDVLRSYAQHLVNDMTVFVHDLGIYRNFPATELDIVTHKYVGCRGGAIYKDGKPIPYIRICLHSLICYTYDGFPEYDHIKDDREIGSVFELQSWKHCMSILLCHEFAHAVRRMQQIKDIVFKVPKTYASYPVHMIPVEHEQEKRNHGRPWQYVYRHLRNNFVNGKENKFWC